MRKLITYLQEVRREIAQVSWPTRQQTQDMTVLVIVVSLIVGAYISALDFIFSKLLAVIL